MQSRGQRETIYRINAWLLALLFCAALLAVPCFVMAAGPVVAPSGELSINTDKYRIMFLSSYSLNDEICKEELKGIERALPDDKCEINYEFMDTRRFGSDYDLSIMYRYLKNKLYRLPEFDCYIAGDEAALSFLLGRRDILGDTPVVYLGIQDPRLLQMAEANPSVTGVQEHYDHQANFDFIKRTLPGVKKLLLLTDDSNTGQVEAKAFTSAVEKDDTFSCRVVNITENSLVEIRRILSSAGEDTAVFFHALFHMDDGSINSTGYMVRRLMEDITCPTFCMVYDMTEYGVLGGVTYDAAAAGEEAAQMALRIAGGTKPFGIPPEKNPPVKAIFNKKAMDRFHILEDQLPKGAVVVEKELTFWEEYRQAIVAISILFAMMVVIIFIQYRKSREQQGMIESDNRVFRRIASEALDFVAVITVNNRMATLRSGTWRMDGREVPENERVMPYPILIERALNSFANKEKREQFQSETELGTMVKILEKQPELVRSYDFSVDPDKPMRKQFTVSWLNKGQKRLLLFGTDTTKSLQEEWEKSRLLREAAEAAKAADAVKSQLLSRISHDIRTPISSLLNLTEFAYEDMDDRQRLKKDLDRIAISSRFLLSLINDVLDISMIDGNKIELNRDSYAFGDYVSEIENVIGPECDAKSLTHEIQTDQESHRYILEIDRARLNQITLNILSNAVKYTGEGGNVIFGAWVDRKDKADAETDGVLQFFVKDNGIGMSERFQEVMFAEFSQEVDNVLRDKNVVGNGLGLSIVKKLVDAMDGQILVESTVGLGTEIRVSIPVRILSGGEEEQQSLKLQQLQLSGRVLLAEDNLINQEITVRILESIGVACDCANNGQEELELFAASEQGTYMAILQDIQMPVMDGYEAVAKLRGLEREDAQTVPIIAMTADAHSATSDKGRASGINEFVTKPINEEIIRRMLVRYGK